MTTSLKPSPSATAPITTGEMIARARAIAPLLRERAEQARAERRVPLATIDDYHRTGLIRLCQPKRFGGYEMGWDVLCETTEILAEADGSQAWIARIMAAHAHMVATFPAEAQDDVWLSNHNALISASFDPLGRGTPVPGGYRLSGRHGFSSGVDHADWAIVGGYIIDGDTRKGPLFFLVPRSDFTIIDDWHTIGLEGTGSKSFEVKDAFVPEHRILIGGEASGGFGPGVAVNNAPVYRTPRGGITTTGFGALTVGMARGVLKEWLLYTAPRKSRGIAVAEQPGTQLIAAQASAEIDAASALYMGCVRHAMRVLEAGGTITKTELLTAKRNVAYACKLALKAGTDLFNAGGGRALFRGNALGRQYTNLLGAASHHAVMWDANALPFAKDLFKRTNEAIPQ